MSTIQDTVQPVVSVEPGSRSAVCSHESYSPQVEAICHHSGRYLARTEINPGRILLLREQHDFPGFPELDATFQRATHAREYQHVQWSKPAVRGVAAISAGILLLIMVLLLTRLADQVGGVVEFTIFYTGVSLGVAGGVGLLIYGARSLIQQTTIYHRESAGLPPAIVDFPLFGSYQVRTSEHCTVRLGNAETQPIQPSQQHCQINIQVHPINTSYHGYTSYRRIYADHPVGQFLHAGAIALENLANVRFPQGGVEYGHRLVLRAPINSLQPPSKSGHSPPISFLIPYNLHPHAFSAFQDERRRFPLECVPRLNPHDSYTLELHFRWRGTQDLNGWLVECRLSVPEELTCVERVEAGRYDSLSREVIWRNMPLRQANNREQVAVLRVTFREPLLEQFDAISGKRQQLVTALSGSFQCFFENGLLSGMDVRSDRVWTTLGVRAVDQSTAVIITNESTIDGTVVVDLCRLSQEHELVYTNQFTTTLPPDDTVIQLVLDTMVDAEVDVHQVEQALPKLDPAGTLHTRLYSWDISGRWYNITRLDAIDVHVVVAGVNTTKANGSTPRTTIDLHVRCLHDPRNHTTPINVAQLRDFLVLQLEQRLASVGGDPMSGSSQAP